MASGGSSVNHWKLISQIRQYLSKNFPSVSDEVNAKEFSFFIRSVSAQKENESSSETVKIAPKTEVLPNPTVETATTYGNIRQALTSLNAYIPQLPQVSIPILNKENSATKIDPLLPKWRARKKPIVSQSSIDARTRHLVGGLHEFSEGVILKRLEELCSHLKDYPKTRGAAVKSLGIPWLLKLLQSTSDASIEGQTREALALLGYTTPVTGRGIRILTIDGGGIRGLVAIELLREIESRSGQPIHKLFDYICGVSTGAIVAILIGAHKLSMDACRKLYQDVSNQIFTQNTIKGTAGLVLKNSFYDSNAWSQVLQEKVGTTTLIETTRNPDTPKISVVATQADANLIKAFLFRNYCLPHRVASHFEGSASATLWEAVRASAAAPGYFSEFTLNDMVLLDGGLMVNNPTAIGIHEARLLWPDKHFQTVVSVGTGRHEPLETDTNGSISWGTRIRTIINSATDTEGVHTTMQDLLPSGCYYRLNPYVSELIGLDEIREEKISVLMEDTRLYIRKNDAKITKAIDSLSDPKNFADKTIDFYNHQKMLWPVR